MELILLALSRHLANILFGVGLAVVLARGLGPRGNGLYALVMLVATTLANFVSLGAGAGNVFFLARRQVRLTCARSTT